MKRFTFLLAIAAMLFVGCNNNDPTALKSITLNKESLELETGDTFTLKAKTDPEDADVKIVWESSKPDIASVSEKGKVEAKRPGRATITAFVGKVYADCDVKVVSPAIPEITLGPNVIDAPPMGGTFTVNVNTTHPWKATWKEDWVKLDITEATGSKKITVTVEPNLTFDAYKSEITFTAGTVSAVLTVMLEARNPEAINLNPNTIEAVAGGGSYKVKVYSAIAWTAKVAESWAKVTPSSGSGDAEVTVTVDPSNTMSDTQQKIEFDNTEMNAFLTVKRAGRDPLPITLSQSTINAPVGGGSYNITVNSELPYTATSSVSWVTVSTSGNKATVVVSENADGSHMGGQVTFKTAENSAVLTVTQATPTLSLSTDLLYSSDEGASLNFEISSNYKWQASSNVSWITLDASSGSGYQKIYVTVAEATTSSATTGYITVKCANLQKGIQVVRSGFDPKCFSVSVLGTKVYFAPGNLYYTASTNKFSFATYQYSYLGNMNANISPTYSSPIDLFGRGTSGYKYKPYESTNSNVATKYCPKAQAQYLTKTQHDWGYYNAIGSDPAGTWRTLGYAEWRYLLKTRKNFDALHTLATVQNVHGLIILPDHFQWPSGVTKFSGSSYSYTQFTYDYTDWKKMEAAGAVFLPAAGSRDETEVSGAGSEGYYWTDKADYISTGQAGYGRNVGYVLHFSTSGIIISDTDEDGMVSIHIGCSVRLVKDVGAQG